MIKTSKKILKEYEKLNLLFDSYDWKLIDYPAKQKDWEKFELNNKSNALNILFVPDNAEKIRLAYKSKCNQVILLMITNDKK